LMLGGVFAKNCVEFEFPQASARAAH
jgi:hypothetical protein